MVQFPISPHTELRLKFSEDQMERFSDCKLIFMRDGVVEVINDDYLYVFVDEMLGRLKDIPVLDDENMWGKIGRWQELYYFERSYNDRHSEKIRIMEKADFVSAMSYGLFLYQYRAQVWLEIDKTIAEPEKILPMDYYSDPANYRVLLSKISADTIRDWTEKLRNIKKRIVSFS